MTDDRKRGRTRRDERLDHVLDRAYDYAVERYNAFAADVRDGDRRLGPSNYVAPSLEDFLQRIDPSGELLKVHARRAKGVN